MAVCDFRFHSYFSIINTSVTAPESRAKHNPFDEDQHSSHAYNSVSSSDITYSASTGRVTFGVAGTYLIVFSVALTLDTGENTTIATIEINGSAQYTSAPFLGNTTYDPLDQTFHLITTVNAGDYLEVSVDSQNSSKITAQNGTSLTVLKANGDYGYLMYTSDASASGGNTEIALFDSNERTADTQTLKNVDYDATYGILTPDNTRKFLMLSTLIGTHSANSGEINHSFFVNGNEIETLPVNMPRNADPLEMSIGLLKSLTADETCSARAQSTVTAGGGGTITANKGTAFSIFDITNNGTDPTAFLSLSVDADSSAASGGGDLTCFDEDGWASYASTSFVTATGITYTASDGTFVVGAAGKYFILWNLVIGTATATGARTVEIKNGTTVVYQAPWHIHTNTDPIEKTVCVILDASAGDSFTFIITAPNGKVDAGTAITMFKVDDGRYAETLYSESTPIAQISDDFTLNNYAIDNLSAQYKKVPKQVPFILGTPGPLSLRGRCFATTETPPNVSTGDKKN